jgi:DNA topoisomerase I
MTVVVVESPTKAKTINRYLGAGYQVFASYGHVRDLPPKDGSVEPDRDFAMSWQVDPKAKKHIDAIAEALKGSDKLYLATDPDREGEAIAWHMQDVLEQRKALNGVEVKRIVFHEITKDAILEAMAAPLDVNQELVDAYLARRALDYLVGFTLSPVLWRKLPGSRSAGRVQSVALRLVCEREAEIEIFRADEYWTIDGAFTTAAGAPYSAHLTHIDGKKLDKLTLADKEAADAAVSKVSAGSYQIDKVERKQSRRNPAPPFTTSTLQQEASRKLGFGASRTMQVAQRLYEGLDIGGETVGLITYMRTDSVTLSRSALDGCRAQIKSDFGETYLPDEPRLYRTTARNAQEAHEAIRPTDMSRTPQSVKDRLDEEQARLYELVWKRTIACQMASAILDQVAVDIAAQDRSVIMRATGSVIKFDGFLKVYQEGKDDAGELPEGGEDSGNERDRRLPPMNEGEVAALTSVTPEQHFTQPPPRYSEASLVKKMEELGIGRPSTYASILKVLQDRDYILLEKRRFVPEDRGRLVTAFLANFFERYIEYDFTADMERQLDDISGGRADWRRVLRDFWDQFSKSVEGTRELSITQVLDALNDTLGRHFFPPKNGENTDAARACPVCDSGRLSLKLGKFGAFVGCSDYPDCRYTRQLVVESADSDQAAADASLAAGPKILGSDPASDLDVSLRKGPYGIYIQLGEAEPADKELKKKAVKPKRVSIPKNVPALSIDLETALKLLSLPRDVGLHPESGEMITAGIGRFGPYLKRGSAYVSLRDDDVLNIGLNRAVTLIAEAKTRGSSGRELGVHPSDSKPVTQHSGRYGPYVKHGRVNATLPKELAAEEVTLEQAIDLLAAKAAKGAAGSKSAKSRKPKAKKKTSGTKRTSAKSAAKSVPADGD